MSKFTYITVRNNILTITSDRKLVILDLNGTLLLRSKSNRKVWGRPYCQSFIDYLLHPAVSTPSHVSSKAGLDILIWSSAQPHSVDFMVENIFGQNATRLIGVWDRTRFGLTKKQYDAKHPTIKDLTRIWKAFPYYSSASTVLLDDSIAKAQRQPDNHICLTEYTSKLRAQDVKHHRESLAAARSITSPVSTNQVADTTPDSILLAIVGILDEMREKDDVATWLRDGGLRTRRQSASTTTEDELVTLLSSVNLEVGNSTPKDCGIWFEDPNILDYWVEKGKDALRTLQIPILASITPWHDRSYDMLKQACI